jgi:hypothetical protein
MGFIAKDTGGGDYKRVPSGSHVARCYSVIDLGTQTSTGQYGIKSQRKIQLGWEVLGDDDDGNPIVIEVDGKTLPLTIRKSYTMSLHEKAGLRKDLAGWRGRDFTDDEAAGFDVSKLLGAYAMLNVQISENNGKTYSNVASVSRLPNAFKDSKPAGVHKNVLFDIDKPDMAVFEKFHESLQKAIQTAPEWTGKKPTAESEGHASQSVPDDEIPF